jgi:TonB-linked SusC/RagA family outer membrane protein
MLCGLAGALRAQTATISGQVVDRATNQPLSDTQISVAGIPRGSRTGSDGRYAVAGVPRGVVEVRVSRVGYQSESRAVSIEAAAVTVDFALVAAAAALDEVVILATGETQRRRESGAATGRIDTSQVSVAVAQTFSDALSSRVAGVVVQQASGMTDGSARIRVRGWNSVNLPNDPMLVVDGIRVDNNTRSTSIGLGGQTPSRFNDLVLDDIESIDIIKGPAGAALFGTGAANGIILVTTKRGKAGQARTTSSFELGSVRDVGAYPRNYTQIGTNLAGTARVTNCNLEAQARNACRPKPDSLVSTLPLENLSPFRIGRLSRVGANTSGGTAATQFYLAAGYNREEGVYATNWLQSGNLRGNISADVRPTVQARLNLGYISSRARLPLNDNTTFGVLTGSLLGRAFDCHRSSENATLGPSDASCGIDTLSRGYQVPNHPSTRFFAIDTRQSVDRLLASAQVAWQALPWLNVIGTSGTDYAARWDDETLPQGAIEVSTPEGYRQSNRVGLQIYSADGSAVGTFLLLPALRAVSTAGAQYDREFFSRTDAFGARLLPGTTGLGGTSERFAVGESQTDVVSLGYLVQQRFEWRDRVFASAALRADKNSNFGVRLPFVRYPAAQLSWVLGEEPFFPRSRWLGLLRLRMAYGESGQRPDFRQADQFFRPVAVNIQGNEVSGITLGGTGNPDLKPERTTEVEFGFDADFLGGRVTAELQRYIHHTRDALITRRLAPSLGATTAQLVNLGRVDNDGYEYLLNLRAVETRRFGASVAVSGSRNRNILVDLGTDALGNPIQPIIFGLSGDTQRHQTGYPLAAYFARRIVSFEDKNGDGIISRVNCPTYGVTVNPQIAGGPACEIVLTDSAVFSGHPLGETELAVAPVVAVGHWLSIRALFDHRGGVTLYNATEYFRCSTAPNQCLAVQSRGASLSDQARAVSTFMGTRGAYFEDATFWKWRELAITVTAPAVLTRAIGAAAASFTVAGRNLKTWTSYSGLDPEVNTGALTNFNTADFLTQPPVRYWVGRLSLTF